MLLPLCYRQRSTLTAQYPSHMIITNIEKNNHMSYNILFVCTGNICRSPAAHGTFRHNIEKANLNGSCAVDSAGTHGYHIGEPPDPRAVTTAQKRGIDLQDLRARKLAVDDFAKFNLIVAMDHTHYQHIKQMHPENSRADIALFLDFTTSHQGQNVPDPYYGKISDFEHVMDLIEKGSKGLRLHVEQILENKTKTIKPKQ